MYNFEADKLVSIRDVLNAFERHIEMGNAGSIEVDLGDAGYHTFNVDDAHIDTRKFEGELLNIAERRERGSE